MLHPFGPFPKREKVFGLVGAGGGSEQRRSDLVKLGQVLIRLLTKAPDPGSGNTVAKNAAVAKPPAATADKPPHSSSPSATSTAPQPEVTALLVKPPASGAKPLPPESSETPRKNAEQPKGPMAKSSATQRPPSPLPSGGTCATPPESVGSNKAPIKSAQQASTPLRVPKLRLDKFAKAQAGNKRPSMETEPLSSAKGSLPQQGFTPSSAPAASKLSVPKKKLLSEGKIPVGASTSSQSPKKARKIKKGCIQRFRQYFVLL